MSRLSEALDIASLCVAVALFLYSLWLLSLSFRWQREIASASSKLAGVVCFSHLGEAAGTSLLSRGSDDAADVEDDVVRGKDARPPHSSGHSSTALLDLLACRAALCALVGAWCVVQLLRLTSLWVDASSLSIAAMDTDKSGRRIMCKFFVAVTTGILEPLILLIPLFLLRSSFSPRPTLLSRLCRPGATEGANVMRMSLAAASPVAVAQFTLVFVPAAVGGALDSTAMKSFFAAWGCDSISGGGISGCTDLDCKFPMATVVVIAAFLSYWLWHLHATAVTLRKHALNASLRARIAVLRWGCTALAVLLVGIRGIYVAGFYEQSGAVGGSTASTVLWAAMCFILCEAVARRSPRELARAAKGST